MAKLLKLYAVALSIIFLFQSSMSFAKQIGPVVKGYYLGMSADEVKKVSEKNGITLRDASFGGRKCYWGANMNEGINVCELYPDENGDIDTIKYGDGAFFGNIKTRVKTIDFVKKFEEKYKINLEFNENRRQYEYIDKNNGFVVVANGPDNFYELVLYRILTHDEEQKIKKQEEDKKRNAIDNIKF